MSRPGRGRRNFVLVAVGIGISAILVGIFWSGLLRRGDEAVAPKVATGAKVQRPPESSAGVKSAGGGPNLDSPLPTTAAALIDEVEDVVDRLIEEFPGNLDCLEMRARFHVFSGKSEEAVKTWERCLDLNPGYSYAYLGMAEIAAHEGDHQKAADLARKSMQTDPASFRARLILAEAAVNLDQPEEAIAVLEEFLRTNPRSHGYFLLGRAYALMDQFEKAKQSYQASIRKDPQYGSAYHELSKVCARLGQKDAAREAMAKFRELFAKLNPDFAGEDMAGKSFDVVCSNTAKIYADIGRIYGFHDRPTQAESLCRRAADLSPKNTECRQALAWFARSAGRTPEQIRWLEELANLDPKNPNYWLEIGDLHIWLTQLQPAEEAFQKARAIAPQDARTHAALAALYLRSGQSYSESMALARTAVELAPTAENYSLLATACERNGDHSGAAAAKEQAAKLTPPSATE